ncbi:anti-sigma factor [Kitasatospora mediocidica]|uniref:hypothetical protein n=1 Tax=Kitasatospora mediocidica TaxID=58352 RepID=UPI0005684E93|nr:hypothetical protein [Kitasatospora mediocidica]
MTNQAPDPVEDDPTASAPSTDQPSDDHPSTDQLADLQEELLGAEEAAAVRTHLDGCAQCADTLVALAELAELLGSDDPPAMPADVALRIDAALAAEAAAHPIGEPASAPVSGSASGSASGPGLPRSPIAAPPGRSDRSSRPGRTAFRRRARMLLAAAGCLAVLGLGAVLVHSGSSNDNIASSANSATLRPADSPALAGGPVFSADGLPSQVQQLLASQPSGSTAKIVPHATNQNADATAPTDQLPGCVRAAVGGDAGKVPLAVGHGRYGSTPVDVYVFPLPADPGRLDVYLLDAGCALHTPAAPATVELHQTVAAP